MLSLCFTKNKFSQKHMVYVGAKHTLIITLNFFKMYQAS